MFTRCFMLLVAASHILGAEPDPRTAPLAAENPLYLKVDAPLEDRVADLIGRMTLEEKAIALNHNGPDLERFGLRGDKWNQCLNGVQWDRPTTLFPSCIAMSATWDTELVQNEIARVLSDEARAIYNGWRRNPDIRSQHKGLIYRDPVINIGRNPYWGRNHEAFGEDPYLTGRMAVAYVRGIQGDDRRYLKLAATLKHYAVNNVETGRFRLDARVSQRMLHEYWLPHFREAVVEGEACSLMASYNAINGTPNNINSWLLTDVLKKQWGHRGFVVSDLGGVRTMVEGHERNRMTYVDAVAKSLMAGCDFSDREFQEYIPGAVREGKLTRQRLDDALARVLRVRFRLGEFDPPEAVPYSKISPDVIACAAHRAVALKSAQKSIVLLQNRGGLLPLDQSKLRRVAVIGPLADRVVLNNYNGRHENLVTPLAGITKQLDDAVKVVHAPGGGVTGPGERVGTRVDRENGFSSGASVKIESAAVGEFIEFPLTVPEAGKYQLTLQFKTFPDRGRFQLSVDGTDLGEPVDMFGANPRYGQSVDVGERQLTAGRHQFRFTVVGRNDDSQGYTGHFDKLTLKGASELAVELERTRFVTGRGESRAKSIEQAADAARGADVAIVFVGTDQTVEQEGRDRRSLGLPGEQLKLVQAVAAVNPRTVVVLQSAGPLTVPWVKENIPAVLQAWWGGEEGGTAIANVLFGEVNPAGRLPHTVYASEEQVPPLDQYDIDGGFTYMYLKGEPLYAFGHGLSYTTFEYARLHLPDEPLEAGGELAVKVDVKNTGDRAGDEVVQLYVTKLESKLTRPRHQLRGFQRIHLKPGETRTVTFTLPVSKLACYDEAGHAFVVEPGQYEMQVGSSSADIRTRGRIRVAGPN
jgi:beta-glucosidase